MRRFFAIILAFTMMLCCVGYTFNSNVDYMEMMIDCAEDGSAIALRIGAIYEHERNSKIEAGYLPYATTNFFTELETGEQILIGINKYQKTPPAYTMEEFSLLSRIIQAEAGSYWLPDELRLCVGEVVLNRMASPEFPNTMREVLEQPGQYYGKNSKYFNNIVPSEKSCEIAQRLLFGERYINDPSVVFQANFILGSGIALQFDDKYLGSSYFCYSSYPELYEVN